MSAMRVSHGASRSVLLIGRWAVKLPRLGGGYRAFLCGLLSNLAERDRWTATHDPALCPVVASAPFGLLLIMPRVEPAAGVPAQNVAGFDHKPSSYGYHRGELVATDYHGNLWREAS